MAGPGSTPHEHEWDHENIPTTARRMLTAAVRDNRVAELRELCYELLDQLQPAGTTGESIAFLRRQVRQEQETVDARKRRQFLSVRRAEVKQERSDAVADMAGTVRPRPPK